MPKLLPVKLAGVQRLLATRLVIRTVISLLATKMMRGAYPNVSSSTPISTGPMTKFCRHWFLRSRCHYSSSGVTGGQVTEFKQMVKNLHRKMVAPYLPRSVRKWWQKVPIRSQEQVSEISHSGES